MQLTKYEAAKHALAEAKRVDEVIQIRDFSAAMKAAARIANDKQLEIDASEIRIRAERKLGEMIRTQKETEGLNTGTQGQKLTRVSGGAIAEPPENNKPTLAEVGISKKLSSRSQALASIPQEQFDEVIEEHRDQQQAVTLRTMETLAKKAHVANNSGNNEWYTPAIYIEAARKVMGTIDTDPATSEFANQTVKAKYYYTQEENGLNQEWEGSVWMNPPYAQPLISQFCDAVATKYKSGEIKQAIVLVNNATETAFFQSMTNAATAICFPKGRIRFVDPQGNPSGAPLQGQAFVYFGKNVEKFCSVFGEYGFCVEVCHA